MTTTPPPGTPSGVPPTPDEVRAEYGAKLKTALSHMQFLKKQLTDEQERSAAARSLVDELRSKEAHVMTGGGAKAMAAHRRRDKLPPRERIAALLDPGSPFLELSMLAGLDLYEEEVPSAGIVCGVGIVHGRKVMVLANGAQPSRRPGAAAPRVAPLGGTRARRATNKHSSRAPRAFEAAIVIALAANRGRKSGR